MTVTASPPRWAALASFAAPAASSILCAGNGMGFFDSPELAAAGAGLGVTHPPGHPLWVAIAAISTLVPAGAVPFRMALAEAIFLGLIGRLAFGIAAALVHEIATDSIHARISTAAALAAALTASLGPGVFRQCTRVEVYALAGLLAVAPLALATRGVDSARRARLAALLLGLGAANHHFIALTAAPVVLWILVARLREARAAGPRSGYWRGPIAWAPLFLTGLAAYALLPLRADAPASLARVRSFADLIDVASARVYARNVGAAVPGSAGSRALDVLDWLGETLTPVGLLFAAGGLYLAVRSPGARPQAARLALLLVVVTAARAWLGFVRDNPDAAGYLVPALVALGIATAGFTAGSARAIAEAPPAPRGPTRGARAMLTVLLVGGPVLLPGYLLFASVRASAVDRAYAAESLALATLSALPPRTILFAYDPQTIFRLRYATLVEGERPDVAVVPVPLLGYPGMTASLFARDRAITPIMTQYMLRPDQGLSPRLLSSLAAERVVALELDPRNVITNVATLLPRGPVSQVMSEPTTLAAVRGAAAAHFTRMDQLTTLLERETGARPLVDESLLWRSYTDALFFAARGARAEARRSVTRGLARAPTERVLIALRDALAGTAEGPLDVRPFLADAP